MNNCQIKGLLGLALRARMAAMGMDACRIMIRSGKCGILLLDGAAGIHTQKKAEDLCKRTDTPIWIVPEGLIEEATGKNNLVMGLQEGSFSEKILQCRLDDT